MSTQEAAVATRQMIHLQVAGDYSQEDLQNLIVQFQASVEQNGIVATPNNVVANVITTTTDLSGLVMTPKMTPVEIATVAVNALNGFEYGQGNPVSPNFAEMDQEAQIEILRRIQHVLRYGSFRTIADDTSSATRDAIFESVTHSLAAKLIHPSLENLITVTRIAQKEGDEDFDINFKDLVKGDIFKHGDGVFVAESNPYVNWIASPIPQVTIDATPY